jgi:hypothetical protein
LKFVHESCTVIHDIHDIHDIHEHLKNLSKSPVLHHLHRLHHLHLTASHLHHTCITPASHLHHTCITLGLYSSVRRRRGADAQATPASMRLFIAVDCALDCCAAARGRALSNY